jgi:hypothetical protein
MGSYREAVRSSSSAAAQFRAAVITRFDRGIRIQCLRRRLESSQKTNCIAVCDPTRLSPAGLYTAVLRNAGGCQSSRDRICGA